MNCLKCKNLQRFHPVECTIDEYIYIDLTDNNKYCSDFIFLKLMLNTVKSVLIFYVVSSLALFL